MKPIRLAILGHSPCERCNARCCRQNVSAYAVLLQGDAERKRFACWSVTLPVTDEAGVVRHERVIPYREHTCPFLGEDDRCTIYEDRPLSCREFECSRHFNQSGIKSHGLFLRHNSDLVAMLEAW